MQRKRRKTLKKILGIFIGLYVMIGSALYFFQEKLLFLPTTLEVDYKYNFDTSFEELFFKTDTDVQINALHFRAKNPKGVILYFHGNAGDLSRWGNIAEGFASLDYDVLVMDYRTYGKSKGKLSEDAFYKDAQYCYDFLLNEYTESQIILYGRSLGTGIAANLASKNNPKQLILETPYYSILDVAEYRFPFLPVKKLLKYHFLTYKFLKKSDCPVTIIHGTDDGIVPYSSALKLSELKLENVDFVTIEGGGHNNLIDFKLYIETINNKLK